MFFSILLFSKVSAQSMRQLNITIDVKDDSTSDIQFSFRFTEEIKEVVFPINAEIKDIKTQYGECYVTEKLEKTLHCKPPSPFMVGEVTILTNFHAKGLTKKIGNLTLFSFDIPILWKTDRIYVTIKLPENVFIAEEDEVLLPISPSGAQKEIEGRNILASWDFRNKNTGDLIPIRIYYEGLQSNQPTDNSIYKWLLILAVLLVIVIIFLYRFTSKKSDLILSVLNEAERMVVDIIKKQGKDNIDQRKIVAQSGFSKAKVSRIVQSLESRGVVSVEKRGRKNRISLRNISFKEKS
jgi:uncharacterized membrane protein